MCGGNAGKFWGGTFGGNAKQKGENFFGGVLGEL